MHFLSFVYIITYLNSIVNTLGKRKYYYGRGCPVYMIPPTLPHLGHSHLASHSPCSCTEIQRFIQYKQITSATSCGLYSSILITLSNAYHLYRIKATLKNKVAESNYLLYILSNFFLIIYELQSSPSGVASSSIPRICISSKYDLVYVCANLIGTPI